MTEQPQRIEHDRVSKEGGILLDIKKKEILSKAKNKERQTAVDKLREAKKRDSKKLRMP